MSETTPDKDERNPFTRPGFILSAALIIALAAAVIVVAVWPKSGSNPAAGPNSSPSTPSPSSSSASEGVEASVCGLSGTKETALGAAPDSDWELVGRTAVPAAPETSGPGAVSDAGIRYCFAKSPSGALFAAANIFGLVSSGEQRAVLTELAADTAARDQQLQELDETQSAPSGAQIRGFQLQNYTESSATIDLGIELPNGAVGSVPIPLVWEGGDWKLNVVEGGISGSKQLNDLSAYIPWSGV